MKVALAVLVFVATALASFALGGLAVTVQLTSPLDEPAARQQTTALAGKTLTPPTGDASDPETRYNYVAELAAQRQAQRELELDAKLRPLRNQIATVTANITSDGKGGVSRSYEQIALLLGLILLLLAVSDLVYQNVFVPAEDDAAGAA